MVRESWVLRCASPLGMIAAASLAWAAPAWAQNWRGTLAVTTDYIQYGISQNDGDAAIQASVGYWNPSGWYIGAWGSQVNSMAALRDYYPRATRATRAARIELDAFAGYGRRLGDSWLLDVKAVGYLYPGDPSSVSYDYLELVAGVTWRERLHASLAVAPSSTWLARTGGVRNRPSYHGELSLQQPLSAWLTWTAGVGYRELASSGVRGYVYGSTSLALQLRRVSFELGFYQADSQAARLYSPQLAGERVALSISLGL